MQGYFIIQCIQTMGKTRIFAALSFPFPHFNLNTLNVNDHLQVTWLVFQQWIFHILLRPSEQNLFAKLHDDWSKQSVWNDTLPNYANYEVTHALTCLSSDHQCKVKMSGGEKKVNNNMYDILSIKCVTKKFLEVSHCSHPKQQKRNVQKKGAACANLLYW